MAAIAAKFITDSVWSAAIAAGLADHDVETVCIIGRAAAAYDSPKLIQLLIERHRMREKSVLRQHDIKMRLAASVIGATVSPRVIRALVRAKGTPLNANAIVRMAASMNNTEVMLVARELAGIDTDVNQALVWAARRGHVEAVHLALSWGPDRKGIKDAIVAATAAGSRLVLDEIQAEFR